MPHVDTYHHAHLRAALLAAAETEIAEKGVEDFSLRRVAKRTGVSHSAPKHHFGDARGLLTALAAKGFQRLISAQNERKAIAGPKAVDQLLAAGLGYIDFALQNPALFRLMFASDRPNKDDPELSSACGAAYQHFITQALEVGSEPDQATGIYAIVHGVADLLVSGRIITMQSMTASERDFRILQIFIKNLPIINQ
jgi:AcrR family transcriptional regulator